MCVCVCVYEIGPADFQWSVKPEYPQGMTASHNMLPHECKYPISCGFPSNVICSMKEIYIMTFKKPTSVNAENTPSGMNEFPCWFEWTAGFIKSKAYFTFYTYVRVTVQWVYSVCACWIKRRDKAIVGKLARLAKKKRKEKRNVY